MLCGYKLATTKKSGSSKATSCEEQGIILVDLDALTAEKIPIEDKNYTGQVDLVQGVPFYSEKASDKNSTFPRVPLGLILGGQVDKYNGQSVYNLKFAKI